MLNPTKPVGECSTQELLFALMLQRGKVNLFNSEQVLEDLYTHQDLWISFFLGPQVVEHADYCRNGLFLILRDINRQWHADTLYVHCRDDECVFPLIELGKSWQCDDLEVFDRKRVASLMGVYPSKLPPVLAFWWD